MKRAISIEKLISDKFSHIKIEKFPAGSYTIQRILDVSFSIGMLIFFSPLIILLGLLIKLSSSGPIFYRGERVGRNGRIFTLYKLRTLKNEAEKEIGGSLMQSPDYQHSIVGRFLRKCRIDEIPQFYNVIKGDMNIIGPRPARPIRVRYFLEAIPGYATRLKVKPGISGLAQIKGDYFTSDRNKLRYDLLYIKNRSLAFNLKLIGLTIISEIQANIEAIKMVITGHEKIFLPKEQLICSGAGCNPSKESQK